MSPTNHTHFVVAPCPYCNGIIRFRFTPPLIGEYLEWDCPYTTCRKPIGIVVRFDDGMAIEARIITAVPRLLDDKRLIKEFAQRLSDAITTNPALRETIEKMRDAGIEPSILTEVKAFLEEIHPLPNPSDSFVKGGEVLPVTFTKDDGSFLGKLHIKIS